MRPRQRDKRGLTGPIGGASLSASPLRAGADVVALAVVLCLGVVLLPYQGPEADTPYLQTDTVLLQVLVVGPLCAMLAAARTRLEGGGRLANLLRESILGATLMAAITSVVLAAMVVGTGFGDELVGLELVVSAFAFFLWNFGAFAFFRVLAYLWPRWVGLRRSRLRWEMTHTTLTVVAAISLVVILASVPYLLAGGLFGVFSLPTRLTTVLPVVGLLIFLAVVALALILPPAALISYFAARRTTRRLESLAHGTSGIREGNFDVRVEVDGEDEVSDLQTDFNAMADDLGVAVRDLRSERDNVERLLKTQRELVASVSHELRTPVATMRGYLESALNGEGDRIPQGFRDDLEVMEREAVRLQRLIDDLFVLSRTEAGQLPLEIGPTDVDALLGRCSAAVADSAWRTGKVEVVVEFAPDLPPVSADEGRLEQVVRNLLQNAVRHTPPGGLVGLSAAADTDAVAIEVKDTGEGIAPEEIDRVFERFYRSDGARKLDHAGAGLGLTLVRDLTEAMNGSVSAESEPGSGSRFTIRLPRA